MITVCASNTLISMVVAAVSTTIFTRAITLFILFSIIIIITISIITVYFTREVVFIVHDSLVRGIQVMRLKRCIPADQDKQHHP